MDIDPSILVTMLNPLEDDGLICRMRDPDDRRRHVVTLTEAGKRRLERAARSQREAEQELFAGLAPDRRGQLEELLVELQGTLTGEHCAAPCLGDSEPCGQHQADLDPSRPATMHG
jgi:DNA-binding MarR family transcriptional regulator